MDATTTEPEPVVPVLFGRPSKKRKVYRQRGTDVTNTDALAAGSRDEDENKSKLGIEPVATDLRPVQYGAGARATSDPAETAKDDDRGRRDDDSDEEGSGSGGDKSGDEHGEDDHVGAVVAELIRRRKARRPKIGGVEFRDGDEPLLRPTSSDRSLVRPRFSDLDMDDMDLGGQLTEPIHMGLRFAPQTGMIGDLVNKHMEEYVEAQLAKRRQADAAAQANALGHGAGASGTSAFGGAEATAAAGTGPGGVAREQLVMMGKLHEVDLGAEARARNIAMTERATLQLRGSGRADATSTPGLGSAVDAGSKPAREGQPPRRKRRNSDDVKRDEMVEQFLHENKMDVDVYDTADKSAAPALEGRPTDDRIAEQFRREFMEGVAQRMRRKRRALGAQIKPKPRNEEEILRGPKLGGSRNVRSAMRDKLLQKQGEERHSKPNYELQLQELKRRANRRR